MPYKNKRFKYKPFDVNTVNNRFGRYDIEQYFCVGGNMGDKTKVTRQEEKETRGKDMCIPYCLQFNTIKAHEQYHEEINAKLDKENATDKQ